MPGHVYTAEVTWKLDGEDFAKGKYSRAHMWRFDGGVEVPASASPSVVPLPFSSESAVDPEEAFVACLSSCHMLTFIDLARLSRYRVESYRDKAEGVMSRIDRGRMAVTKVILRPQVTLLGSSAPDPSLFADLHEKAHEMCFIANSVKTEIEIAPEPLRLIPA
ncbi:OsmC family protein [Roseibium polysiphoniae]|uniref:OsmC family protein n=1 Tax=Roseibium polysiphoniae TaxID=2571221 RepID=UPI003298DD39